MAKIQKKSKQQFHLIPFFYFPPKDCPSEGQLSPLGFAACQSKKCTNRAVHAPTLQSSHGTRRTHRTFWQIKASHRLHRFSQKSLGGAAVSAAPTKQSGTNITILPRNTQNPQKRQVGRLSHRLHGYAQIRRVWHPCHTHAATKLSSHRIHGTQKRLAEKKNLCTSVKSVGGSSPPEASVYSVNSVGGLAQANLEWVLWKEFGGQRGYGRDAIPSYENSHGLHGYAQIRRQNAT